MTKKQNGLTRAAAGAGGRVEAGLKNISRGALAMPPDLRTKRGGGLRSEVNAAVDGSFVVTGGLKFDKDPEQAKQALFPAPSAFKQIHRTVTY
ncbi:MAG TPA: hypothetical protein VMD58_07905 [Acidobacteriaceae bacterium]|nr:hypothetical protein [Acidobacteriaceae bacterium]